MSNLINYTGKLNYHVDYVKMLLVLETKCQYIGIAYENELINHFKKDIIRKEKSSSWWKGETTNKVNIYYIKSSKEIFKYLEKYETFCKYLFGDVKKGIDDKRLLTDFGYSDIAFFDNNDNILLSTNTQEAIIMVSQDIDKLFKKENKENGQDVSVNRISLNENRFENVVNSLNDVKNALDVFALYQNDFKELNNYYGSKEWFKDKDDYEKDLIPKIKAGVLSEDLVWLINEEVTDVLEKMKLIANEYKNK